MQEQFIKRDVSLSPPSEQERDALDQRVAESWRCSYAALDLLEALFQAQLVTCIELRQIVPEAMRESSAPEASSQKASDIVSSCSLSP